MHYAIGFVIALFIALTGVGAGTITVPILILFLDVPAAAAVGIGLMFSAAVKAILVPAQVARGNVAWRTLGFMLLGGVPGVLLGSLMLRHMVSAGSENLLKAILGAILVGTASWQIFYSFRPMQADRRNRDRSPLLSWLMFPVGAEVGFSSAGAGALGACTGCGHRHSVRVHGITDRQRRALVFAYCELFAGGEFRTATAAYRGRRSGGCVWNADERLRPAQATTLRAVGVAADTGR
jgi:Sulfite exporter TauE/SafE